MIEYVLHNGIAVISIDREPVNSLGVSLRTEINRYFRLAEEDQEVDAILITSGLKIFSAGADIEEFGSDLALAPPSLPDICNLIESSNKLVVAALNGPALGGGCELALACDYRFARKSASIGLPEVNLGILPGAGGTQRLPRIIGLRTALDMIVNGKVLPAPRLFELGLIDSVCLDDVDFRAAAIAYTVDLLVQKAPLRNCANLEVDVSGGSVEEICDDFFASLPERAKALIAPQKCLEAVKEACSLALEDGLIREGEIFGYCMSTSQAKALQHIFFAEREVFKLPGISKDNAIKDIKKVAIIGSGTMGGGIAMNFLNTGYSTVLLDKEEEFLDRGVSIIDKNYQHSLRKGRLTEDQVGQAMSLLSRSTSYDDLHDVDLVIEAVFEDMDVKKQVFRKLDAVCKPGTVIATNTSTLDVNEIASVTKRPQDVVGLHFFSPANVMRLLEIVKAENTSDEALMTCVRMAKRISKIPVVAGVCWGFIGNRMLEPYGRECARLMLEGATPQQIDAALGDFGFAMGFPSMIDLAGIDVSYMTRQGNRDALYSRDKNYAAILDELYRLERYGQKTGRGFYLYEGRNKTVDPALEELAIELSNNLGISRRQISDEEIIERTVYMLINEGAQILEEGIALRAGDIDVVYCNGYGFPKHKGGPMQYANEVGLEQVVSAINGYSTRLGEYGDEWFKPAPLLVKLLESGKDFSSVDV